MRLCVRLRRRRATVLEEAGSGSHCRQHWGSHRHTHRCSQGTQLCVYAWAARVQWCDQGAQVRMQAEGARDKPRYKNTPEGFVTIARTEGIRGLYKVPFMQCYSIVFVLVAS
jgi:hypothetical protein